MREREGEGDEKERGMREIFDNEFLVRTSFKKYCKENYFLGCIINLPTDIP